MTYLNQVTLIGNTGKEPEVLKTTAKTAFVRISLATTKKYYDDQGNLQQETQWHRVYLSNGQGKVAEAYIKKGDLIYIHGELRNRSWVDEDKKTHYEVAIYAREFQILSGRSSSATQNEVESSTAQESSVLQEEASSS